MCHRWYLQFKLSFRDLMEMGLSVGYAWSIQASGRKAVGTAKATQLDRRGVENLRCYEPQLWDCWSEYRSGMTVLARCVSIHVQQYSELVAAS